jgi:hypothetical protein
MTNTRLRRCIHWTGSPGAAEHTDVRERPGHGSQRLVAVYGPPWLAWHDAVAVFEVRREHPVETGEIQVRPGDQCRQPGDEIQRLEHDMRGTIPERLLVLVHDPAVRIDGQPLGRNRGAGNVAAQAFQAAALPGLADCGSVEGKTGHPGQQWSVRRLVQ